MLFKIKLNVIMDHTTFAYMNGYFKKKKKQRNIHHWLCMKKKESLYFTKNTSYYRMTQ